jgi:Cu+-exporting ATPase
MVPGAAVRQLAVAGVEPRHPVVLWAGWPFHRAAWANLRHATATMDTLVSVGTLAAWAWSVVALFFGDAGTTGMTMGFDLVPDRSASLDHVYFEVARVVITFLLAGRCFEARAKRRAGRGAGGAARARRQGRRGPRGRWDGAPSPGRGAHVGRRFVVRPGRRSPRTAASRRAARPSIRRC